MEETKRTVDDVKLTQLEREIERLRAEKQQLEETNHRLIAALRTIQHTLELL